MWRTVLALEEEEEEMEVEEGDRKSYDREFVWTDSQMGFCFSTSQRKLGYDITPHT